jgi:hypothetical protein
MAYKVRSMKMKKKCKVAMVGCTEKGRAQFNIISMISEVCTFRMVLGLEVD